MNDWTGNRPDACPDGVAIYHLVQFWLPDGPRSEGWAESFCF